MKSTSNDQFKGLLLSVGSDGLTDIKITDISGTIDNNTEGMQKTCFGTLFAYIYY